MSQNKTVIQGLEAADTKSGGNSPSSANFYTRGQNSPAKGTVVPGMTMHAQSDFANQSTRPINNSAFTATKPAATGKPIVGFLYSVSRTALGEYWPLHLGKNSIGKDKSSDIQLSEGTVSINHAVIITRQGKSGIIAAIKDTESTNGTFINGEPIDFSAEECHNGDIITIGNNYQFLFLLIDAKKIGLTPSQDFLSIPSEDDDDDEFDETDNGPYFTTRGTRPGGFDPFDGPTTWGNKGGGYSPNGGTVGMDGTPGGGMHGGTIPM